MDATEPHEVFKHCLKCGSPVSLEPTAGNPAFQCGACGFHFFYNPAAAVVALIESADERLLVIRRARDPARGTLDLPGGFVDLGENAETALRREVRSEVNLELREARYFGSYCNRYPFGGLLVQTVDLVFTCTPAEWGELRTRDHDEVADVKLLRRDELTARDFGLESARRIVADYASPEDAGS